MITYTPDLTAKLTSDTDEPMAVIGMPDPVYREAPGVSQSQLKPFLRSIKHGAHAIAQPGRQTAAMHFGTAMHTLMLDGTAEFHRKYAVGGPTNEKTGKTYGRDTKAFQEWMSEQGDREYVSPEEMARLSAMEHEIKLGLAGQILSTPGVLREVSLFWTETVNGAAIRCKGRLDWFHPEIGIVDLKTADDCRADAFKRAVKDRGYHIQAAWYRRGVEACGFKDHAECRWIVIETKPPHDIGLHMPETSNTWFWDCGLTAALRALHRYAAWKDGDTGAPDAFTKVPLHPAAWEDEQDIEKYTGAAV